MSSVSGWNDSPANLAYLLSKIRALPAHLEMFPDVLSVLLWEGGIMEFCLLIVGIEEVFNDRTGLHYVVSNSTLREFARCCVPPIAKFQYLDLQLLARGRLG